MKRAAALLLLGSVLSLPLFAGGAGGVEFTQAVGRDLWSLPGGSGLPSSTGQITGIGGLGYGVLGDGSLIGGFGMGVTSRNLDLAESPVGSPLKGFFAGYGGVVQGWQHRWGPLVGTLTSKIGFGGADWEGEVHTAGFSMLGLAEAEVAVLMFPWCAVGVKGGAAVTATFVVGEPVILAYAPVVGFRITWGAY